jgi:hypothetical protein
MHDFQLDSPTEMSWHLACPPSGSESTAKSRAPTETRIRRNRTEVETVLDHCRLRQAHEKKHHYMSRWQAKALVESETESNRTGPSKQIHVASRTPTQPYTKKTSQNSVCTLSSVETARKVTSKEMDNTQPTRYPPNCISPFS